MAQCLGRLKNGERCPKPATYKGYCPDHPDQPPTSWRFAPDISLDDMNAAINNLEKDYGIRIISLAAAERNDGSAALVNRAGFRRRKSAGELAGLVLMEMQNKSDKHSVINEHISIGKVFEFESSVIIKGERRNVLAFREPSDIGSRF